MKTLGLLSDNIPLVVTVLLTIGLWAGFMTARHSGGLKTTYCGVDALSAGPDCTPSYLIRRDPYCIVDPVCVSPSFDESAYLYGQGIAIVGDPAMVTSPIRMLAIPNLCFFLTAFSAIAWLTLLIPAKTQACRLIVTAILAWYTLEVCRWFEALWRFSSLAGGGNFLLQPLNYCIFLLLLMPCLVVYWSARRPRAHVF